MDEVVTCSSVIRRVASKYNPGYNHTKFLTCIVDNLKALGKLERFEKNG